MRAIEAIEHAANAADIPQTRLCTDAGLNRTFIATTRRAGSDPSMSAATRLFGACGYALCAVPSDHVPDDALVIDDGEA